MSIVANNRGTEPTPNQRRLSGLDGAGPAPGGSDPEAPPTSSPPNVALLGELRGEGPPAVPNPSGVTTAAATTPPATVSLAPPGGSPQRAGRSEAPWLAAGIAAGVLAFLVVGAVLLLGAARDEGQSSSSAPPPSDSSQELVPSADTDIYAAPQDMGATIAAAKDSTIILDCRLGQGSGFVVDAADLTGGPSQILIITNHHVIDGCEAPGDLTAVGPSGSSPVTILGSDPARDLAIVRAAALDTPPLPLGALPKPGQWVLAAGGPYGVAGSVSTGTVTNYVASEALITHSAVIGPGSSGGPLVDNQGRVLGVNNAVWEDATGISLAVPISALCVRLLDCR